MRASKALRVGLYSQVPRQQKSEDNYEQTKFFLRTHALQASDADTSEPYALKSHLGLRSIPLRTPDSTAPPVSFHQDSLPFIFSAVQGDDTVVDSAGCHVTAGNLSLRSGGAVYSYLDVMIGIVVSCSWSNGDTL